MSGERERPRPSALWRQVLPLVLVLLYAPLVTLVIASFRDEGSWSFRWYEEVVNDPVLLASLGRSLLVAGGSALVSTVLGVVSALALNRWRFRGSFGLETLSSISLVLPELVLGLSLLSWFALVGMSLSLWTVSVAHVTFTLPFATLIVAARLNGLDESLEDAARDLGASESQVLMRVTLPLLMPSIVSAYMLSFLLSFDDFIVTFFTSGAGSDLLPVRLYSMMKTGLSPKALALSTIMLALSVVLIVLVARRRSFREFAGK